jgi:septum formation protein
MKLVIASTSPRRKILAEMLAGKLGMEYECVTPKYDEEHSSYDDPVEIVKLHSMGKAMSVALDHPHSIVVGGDLLVVFEGTILGKPKGKNDAKRMLKLLSGRWHQVISGIAVINTENEKKAVDAVISKVKLKNLRDAEIDEYIATGEPLDKAGAYDIAGNYGRFLIDKYEGEIEAIRGLPFQRVKELINVVSDAKK